MSYSIVSDPVIGTSFTTFVRQPFDISFGSTFTLYPSSIQFTDSTTSLLSNAISNKFVSASGFTTKGNLGNLVVDSISFISPIASTIANKIVGNSSYQGIAISNNTVYFSDANNHRIYTCDLNGGSITSFAGTGAAGFLNGFRTSATFTSPNVLEFDSLGNLYVSELFDVRKIDTAGNVTSVAGSNVQGAVNGIGSAARFKYITDLRIDPNDDNTLYVVDTDCHCIRKIELSTCNVTTYAGQLDSAGFIDNTSLTGAKFFYPRSLDIRTDNGDFYISDGYNHRIRKISGGLVSTYAGNGSNADTNGTLTSGSFSFPSAITYDISSASLYVFHEAQTIKKVTSSNISTYIGKSGVFGSVDGDSTVATFNSIVQLTTYNQNLFASQLFGVLRKIQIAPQITDARPGGSRPTGYTIVATQTIPVQSLTRIDASTNAIGGTYQLKTYAGFNGNIYTTLTSNTTLQYTNSSTETLAFLSNVDVSTVSFSSTTGFRQAYNYPLNIVINAVSNSSIVDTLSNTVIVNAAGFDTNGISNFTFYRNEPIGQYSFIASLPIRQPLITSPSLPSQLSLTQQDNVGILFYLSGTPLTQSSTTTYTLIGKGLVDPTRIITSTINIQVLGERLLMDICGSSNVPLITESPIVNRLITASAPPYPLAPNRIRYSWSPALPDGLSFANFSLVAQSNPFIAPDTNSTAILTGTPSSNAAINASSNTFTTRLTAIRLASPNISNSIDFTFSFSEQVLFQTANIQSVFYRKAAINSSVTSNSFYAFTKFATVDSSIVAMWSPDLHPDLSLNFISNDQRAYLNQIPDTLGSFTFTVYARNANGVTGNTTPISYSVINDTITFTPITDTCLNFIVSRPATNEKIGYYTAPIDFKASSTSGCNFVVSTNSLTGTGLSLSNVSNNTYRIVGIPTTVTPLTTLTVDASSTVTSATGSTSIQFAIVPDVFSFVDTSFIFIQNRQITPYRFDVSTLSERPIVGYFSSNAPSGLNLSSVGILSGTPTVSGDSSFNVVATTGYVSATKSYNYSIIPDSMLLFTNPLSYTYPASSSVDIQITGLTYSGKTVSNYMFSNFTPSYGLSIGSSSGNITGTLTDSIPPNLVLPPLCNFYLTAESGLLDGSLNGTLTTTNPIQYRSHILVYDTSSSISTTFVYGADGSISNIGGPLSGSTTTLSTAIELQVKNTTLDSNIFLASASGSGGPILRSTNGNTFSKSFLESPLTPSVGPRVSSIINKPNTSTWWTAMYSVISNTASIVKSTDDGLTWDLTGRLPITTITSRNGNGTIIGTTDSNAYIAGIAMRYSNGILMAGGLATLGNTSMARSTDEGSNWTNIATGFATETANFSLDNSSVWVAIGSDYFKSWDTISSFISPTDTIKYSTDQGLTWSNVSGGFNVFAYDIQYASNTWVATGMSYYTGLSNGYKYEVRYSTDGLNWSVADISSSYVFGSLSGGRPQPPIPLGSVMNDGSNWNVFVYRPNLSGPGNLSEIYTHDNTSLSTGWTSTQVSTFNSLNNVRFTRITPPVYVRTGDPILATITFDSLPPNGPVFTTPTQTSFVFYQYMKITPIVFNATGTGRIYYLIDTNDLPIGLSFDPLNQTITGTPMRLGQNTITIYARDDIGVTKLILNTNTIIPNIVKNQTSAGAYTSLIRQYTEVNAAQNARDRRVLPSENKNLGEFQSPYKLDAVTQSNCPKCEP